MRGLFQHGQFELHSGLQSRFKIECDALTMGDWYTLAEIARDMMPTFKKVVGVPRGGLNLAGFLNVYEQSDGELDVLIVDDVLTTGGSMERTRHDGYVLCNVGGLVVFARSTPPDWVVPIFQMRTE